MKPERALFYCERCKDVTDQRQSGKILKCLSCAKIILEPTISPIPAVKKKTGWMGRSGRILDVL